MTIKIYEGLLSFWFLRMLLVGFKEHWQLFQSKDQFFYEKGSVKAIQPSATSWLEQAVTSHLN